MSMHPYSDKHKHLEFIQAAINRMAQSLFLLKGWTVTLIAAMFALSQKDANMAYAVLAYFPLLIFWALDGYFLAQERRFRALYDEVRSLDESKINFSMDTRQFSSSYRNTWFGALFSRTLMIYYLSLAVMMFILILATRDLAG